MQAAAVCLLVNTSIIRIITGFKNTFYTDVLFA